MENLKKKTQLLLNFYKSKNLSKAELLNKELISAHPKVVNLYNILGLVLTEQKKIDESITYYKKGIKIDPNYAAIYNNLASSYQLKNDYSKAENYFKKSIDLDSKSSESQNNLGNLYLELNDHQKAINCYKNAIKINPNFFVSHYNLGVTYKNIGKFDEARKHLEESVKLKTHFYTAHRILSQITKYKINDNHFNFLKNSYENTKINNEQKAEIAFALGKASEDIKNFDKAFKYYKDGNDYRRKVINFSIEDEKEEFANIKKIFNRNFFDKFKKSENLDSTPIFILGMPRSGTTLVEQILSSHPKVFGGDELNFLPKLLSKYFYNKAENLFLENINNIKRDKLKEIGQEYINKLKNISNNSERVSDKLPINFKWIGLIKIMFPNSKVVHCIRSPRDNCISIFKTYFTNTNLNFAYNLKEISEFYKLYNDLMIHWKNILKEFVIDIEYEEIIHDPEQQIRSLLKSCDLGWNINCLKFYNNKRIIKTASDTQARKKIYKSSIDSWKNYEKFMGDSFKNLED